MTPREVKAKLKERNIRQVDLAKKWRIRASVLNMFIHNKFTSARLEARLAKELGMTVEQFRGQENRSA